MTQQTTDPTHDPADADALLALAREVSGRAAAYIREARAEGVEVADTKSSATDVVTAVDRGAEELIRGALLAARPDDAVMGEEGDDHPGTSGVRWIVDPIDGTVNFLYGVPAYAVSIAAEVDGEVWAGVVEHVVTGQVYSATRGGGAWRDGVRLRVRPTVPVSQRLMATGFSYRPDSRQLQIDAFARLLPRIRDIRRIGSSALDVCMVAEGSLDAYAEEGVWPWDFSASRLIAEEAGARTSLRPARWGGYALLCGPAEGFDELADLVDEVGLFGE